MNYDNMLLTTGCHEVGMHPMISYRRYASVSNSCVYQWESTHSWTTSLRYQHGCSPWIHHYRAEEEHRQLLPCVVGLSWATGVFSGRNGEQGNWYQDHLPQIDHVAE